MWATCSLQLYYTVPIHHSRISIVWVTEHRQIGILTKTVNPKSKPLNVWTNISSLEWKFPTLTAMTCDISEELYQKHDLLMSASAKLTNAIDLNRNESKGILKNANGIRSMFWISQACAKMIPIQNGLTLKAQLTSTWGSWLLSGFVKKKIW